MNDKEKFDKVIDVLLEVIMYLDMDMPVNAKIKVEQVLDDLDITWYKNE
jgi:hypothetical protein